MKDPKRGVWEPAGPPEDGYRQGAAGEGGAWADSRDAGSHAHSPTDDRSPLDVTPLRPALSITVHAPPRGLRPALRLNTSSAQANRADSGHSRPHGEVSRRQLIKT